MRYTAVSDFSIKGGKGDIAIKSGQTIDLPEDRAKTLIDRGKIKAISVKWDVLSKIHLSTARTLSAEGVNFRLSTPAIVQAEDALNEIWHACLKGQANIDDFKGVNEQWASAIREANKKSQKTTLF